MDELEFTRVQSVTVDRQLTCPLVDVGLPCTKFNLFLSRQQCSFSRQTCYLSCTPIDSLLLIDKWTLFRSVDKSWRQRRSSLVIVWSQVNNLFFSWFLFTEQPFKPNHIQLTKDSLILVETNTALPTDYLVGSTAELCKRNVNTSL